jgi:diguanylate cyclase (GGDEF)-like protein
MSYHDSLTGLPNRNLFSDRLGIALAQAQRNQKRVGVAMLDLDKFKDVNDTLGHDVGDLLLKAATERLNAALRKGDTIARFGGDEFALLLPQTELVGAVRLGERILRAVRRFRFDGRTPGLLTCSIGVAVYPDDGCTVEGLIERADAALYRAKAKGKNSITTFGELSAVNPS